MALNQLYNLELGAMEIARLAQIVENRVAGAPCGIMDQVTAIAGTSTKILSILCQPDKILEFVSAPLNVSFVGIHTKVRRSTASTAYIDTRIGAFMGLTILKAAFASGAEASSEEGNYAQKISDALADNYLCNVSGQEFNERCEPLLPEQIHGDEFLERYGEIADTATQVEPEKIYPVKSRVEHMIYENARAQQFIAAIKNAGKDPEHIQDYLTEAGNLMYESNASYRDLAGLGSPEVDGLVNIARKIGEQGGIYGAKITGGGGGGTVALLCHGSVENSLTQVLAAYKLAWGIDGELIRGNAVGAYEFGHILWELKESEPPTHF
jgi:L-arabinokinase